MAKPQAARKPVKPGYYWIKTAERVYNPHKGKFTWDSPKVSEWQLSHVDATEKHFEVNLIGTDCSFPWDGTGYRDWVVVEVSTEVLPPPDSQKEHPNTQGTS